MKNETDLTYRSPKIAFDGVNENASHLILTIPSNLKLWFEIENNDNRMSQWNEMNEKTKKKNLRLVCVLIGPNKICCCYKLNRMKKTTKKKNNINKHNRIKNRFSSNFHIGIHSMVLCAKRVAKVNGQKLERKSSSRINKNDF